MHLTGIWQARGYGWLLEIRTDGYSLYDRTPVSCVEFERASTAEFEKAFAQIEQVSADKLSLHVGGDITRYWFDRIPTLPDNVQNIDDPRILDPQYNFDVFFKTFEQDYAFFDRHGIDWQQIYQDSRSIISAQTSEKELLSCFKAAVTQLQDNHVYITTKGETFTSDRIQSIKNWMVAALDVHDASLGNAQTIRAYGNFLNRVFLHNKATFAGNGLICWGTTACGIGYLGVLRLFGFANTTAAKTATGLPAPRYDVAGFLDDDLRDLETILDRVMHDLSSCSALILDVRVNGGGFDKAGIAIANRFADKKRLAFTKKVRCDDQVVPRQEFYITPAGATQFTKPVYLLTGQRTASAGEILVMCMMTLPHVTRVGQPTLGIFSDDLAKHLPNGWVTSISNEIYATADGTVYEAQGIPAQIETTVFQQENFLTALEEAVNVSIALAQNRQ